MVFYVFYVVLIVLGCSILFDDVIVRSICYIRYVCSVWFMLLYGVLCVLVCFMLLCVVDLSSVFYVF